jgi:Flp pilus assembly protein TadG
MKHLHIKDFLPTTILHRQEGVSLAEFALILPVFLMLLLGMVDLGQGFNTYIGMLNATREGAIWLARNPEDLAGMNTRITSELNRANLTTATMTISRTPDKLSYDSGDIVTLNLDHSYQLMFGAITGLPTLTLHTEHTMRVQ